jgi:AcrR family transcriptional regulator
MTKPVKKSRKSAENPAPSSSLPALQERSRETRDRLLAAAEQAFALKGYEGARIADIAKAAGCSAGAVYFRFKDKDALFAGIVDRFAEDGHRRIQSFADSAAKEGAPALIHAFINGTAELFSNHRGLFRVVLERGAQYPMTFMPVMKVRMELDAVLDKAVRSSGAKPGKDLDLKVRVAMQMIFGFLFNAVINPLSPIRADGQRAIDELTEAVVAYLRLGTEENSGGLS